ncbi:MAG: penicillin-insensitive murein endopeptidase [Hyphomicrobiaceae bacterium]
MRRTALAVGIIATVSMAAASDAVDISIASLVTAPAAAEPRPVGPFPPQSTVEVAAKGKKSEPVVAAKTIFGAEKVPAPLAARSIGFYSRGCLAGAIDVPVDGKTWQVMRLSRNRNWGHPKLVALIKRLAKDGAEKDGWPGLLVGDISQPRGGPMLTGHASHQIGLDADIWLTPMPDHRLTREEREKLSATSMLGPDKVHADPAVFTPRHSAIIRRAASYPEVERVLVHPGIKKAMCEEKGVSHKDFHKIRPYWGHHYHMHIRIACPAGSTNCREQAPTANDDGCGKEVDQWIALLQRPPKIAKPGPKPKPKPPITLADLPAECRGVIAAGKDDGKKSGSAPAIGPRQARTP